MKSAEDLSTDELINNLFNKDAEEAVILTDRAVKQIHKIRADENIPDDQFLRVGVKGGGCSGMSYILGFDTENEFDMELDRSYLAPMPLCASGQVSRDQAMVYLMDT